MLKPLAVFCFLLLFLFALQGCYTPYVGMMGGWTEGNNPVNGLDNPSNLFNDYSVGFLPNKDDSGFTLLPSFTNHQSDYLNYQDTSLNLGWGFAYFETKKEFTYADFGISYGKANVEGKTFVGLPGILTDGYDTFVFPDQSAYSRGLFIKSGYTWPSGFGFLYSYSVKYITVTGTLTEESVFTNGFEVRENQKKTLSMQSFLIGVTYLLW